MDLSIPLVAVLGLIGYNTANTVNRETTEKRKKIPTSERAHKTTPEYRKDEQSKLDAFYKDKNSIVGTNRFQTSVNSQSGAVDFTGNVVDIPQKSQVIATNMDKRIYAGPMFNGGLHFIPEAPIANVKESFSTGDVSQLSGEKTDFSHTNMQPFFGGRMKSQVDSGAVLEKYTGEQKGHRQEVKASVNPQQKIGSMQAYTDLVDRSRFVPGMMVNNVVPFAQYKEQPIPGQYVRGQQKTVDELRTLNKPRTGGLEAPANHGAGEFRRAVDPNFSKNKQNTAFMGIFGQGHGEIKRERQVYDTEIKYTSKGDTTEAEYNLNPALRTGFGNRTTLSNSVQDNSVDTQHLGTKRHNFAGDWVRNAGTAIGKRNEENTHTAYTQERETTSIEHFGFANDPSKGDILQSLDKPRTTNKQLSLHSYTPSAQAPVKASKGREFYEAAETKTKPQMEYFAGGLKKFAPQRSTPHVDSKNRPVVKDHKTPAKMNNIQASRWIGAETSNKKHRQSETDFSYRLS